MSTDNDEQVRYWNDTGGVTWVVESDRLDAQLEPFSEAVLAAAAVRPGERVLDVGCGCGATTLSLAAAVSPNGGVVGVDVSAPMLDLACRRAAEKELTNVEFLQADAQTEDLPGPFDVAFSRYGVMFFADPVAAFANIGASLTEGGRLAFVCWQALKENLWAAIPGKALVSVLPEKPPTPDPEAPGPFAFADGDRLADLLRRAGFREISVESLRRDLQVGATTDPEEAVRLSMRIGPASRLLADYDQTVRDRATDAIRDALAPYAGPDGVRLAAAAWLVTARR